MNCGMQKIAFGKSLNKMPDKST